MGIYINPESDKDAFDKMNWLRENGKEVNQLQWMNQVPGELGIFPVCLVDNDIFYAAGVAYDDFERRAFTNPCGRRKMWFLVHIDKMKGTMSEVYFKILSDLVTGANYKPFEVPEKEGK